MSDKKRASRPKKKTQHHQAVKNAEQWSPNEYDFVFSDSWDYEIQNGKRVQPSQQQQQQLEEVSSLQPPQQSQQQQQQVESGGGGVGKRKRRSLQLCASPTLSITRDVTLFVPAFLSRGLWNRHRYTRQDISNTLQCFKPYHLWHLAISERLSLTKLAVQASYAAKDAFVYGAKAIVISHLEAWFAQTYDTQNEYTVNMLPQEDSAHVPPLPLWPLGLKDFKSYLQMLPPKGQSIYQAHKPIEWRGIEILPMELERSRHLLMARVLPEDQYTDIYGEPECLTMQPLHVTLSTGARYAVCDEAFHFVLHLPPVLPLPTPLLPPPLIK